MTNEEIERRANQFLDELLVEGAVLEVAPEYQNGGAGAALATTLRELVSQAYEEAAQIASKAGWDNGDTVAIGACATAALYIRALKDSLLKESAPSS